MKILIYGINYYPEPTGIGKYTSEFAAWFAERGVSVEVLTGLPHYPNWKLYPGFRRKFTTEKIGDVSVSRTPHFIPNGSVTVLQRIALETSFTILSLRWWMPLLFRKEKPDLVIAVCPPLQLMVLPWIFSCVKRVPWIMWVQDFQVDAAFRLGMLRPGVFSKILFWLEGFFLKKASAVVSISGPMCKRAIAKGATQSKTMELLNWANINIIKPADASDSMRTQFGIGKDSILVLYSGAMGQKQGLEIVIEAAALLKADKKIQFIVAGEGSAKVNLEHLAQLKSVDNIKFLPVQSSSDFVKLMASADIHLVIQKIEAADLVMPSKLTNILSSGRPCIATALGETAVGEVILKSKAGLLVDPGDAKDLARAIQELANDSKLRLEMGNNARMFAEEMLDSEAILNRFFSQISGLRI